jgi:hypothetical protein
MVNSIEIPTSIVIPITTAASTESLCEKFMFSYAKTSPKVHRTEECYRIVRN